MSAVSTTTARDAGPRPGRRRLSRGRARGSRRTSGSRRSGRSRGGGDARPAGMITKTQKVDLGPGVPEKKKKKKKIAVVKEPETQYSVLNSDDYFSDISPARPISPSDNVGQGQVSEMSLGKKKKKKKDHHTSCKEFSEPEPLVCARLTESPSARNQVLDQLECLSGEKKKKRKSLSLAASQSSKLKTSPDPKQGKEVRRKALQEEIDRESGKTEASEPRKWTVSSLVSFFFTQGTQFGQWDTAGFENEEQKLKFLKLMGGFKHLSPSFNRPPNMTGRPNMALSKK
uniref:Lysine rich nucleolar protein 1 n=1 Tax=Jaculus jaculus TaxID=51337 RepID=A0A8C5K4X2_JACJA